MVLPLVGNRAVQIAGDSGERAAASVDGEPFELARIGEGKIGIAGAIEQIGDFVMPPFELVDRLAEQLGEQLGVDGLTAMRLSSWTLPDCGSTWPASIRNSKALWPTSK